MEKGIMEKKKFIDTAYNLGFEYEKKYRGCAQCTIAAVQDTLNINNDTLFKSASGLGAGCGLLCDGVCGGYSGGIMVMSSLFGRRRERIDNDDEEKYCAFRMAKLLHDKFIDEYDSVICNAIHQKIFGRTYNLWDANEKEEFNKNGAHESKCTEVVAKASSWVVQLILEEAEVRGITLRDLCCIT